MALENYDDLKASIADWLDRDDLTTVIPDFILMAENRFDREVRIRDMIRRSTTTTSDSKLLALPADYLEMKRLMLNYDPVRVVRQTSADQLAMRFANGSSGKPNYFAVHECIEFDRVPTLVDAEIIYYARLTNLSDVNPTNVLLNNNPDLYLFASLLAAEAYTGNDPRIPIWSQAYAQAAAQVTKNHRLGQITSGPVQSTVDGPTP